MPKLFGVTLFVSATLLFLVQPMVGKMVLPLLGGTPAVWNTCMVFFQALLDLAGLLVGMDVERQSLARRVRAELLQPLAGAGTHGVGGDTDCDLRSA